MEIKKKLIKDFQEIKKPNSNTCIKYFFKFKKVNVNMYFDAFYENNISLIMILNYEKKYYFTSLNPNIKLKTEYLKEIPYGILKKILDNNKLNNFFEFVIKKICAITPKRLYYDKDKIFVNTIKYNKKSSWKNLPFISHLRRANMSDKTYENLRVNMGIDLEILNKIKESRMTVVRTSDPKKRNSINVSMIDQRK